MISAFLLTFWSYILEVWWALAIGFLCSGLVYYYLPENSIEKYLGRKGLKSLLMATVTGIVLPTCCIGSLPLAITFKKKGANIGAVLAFLIAAPATSISAIIMSLKLLGSTFTLYLVVAVIVIALCAGLIANFLNITQEGPSQEEVSSCCHKQDDHCSPEKETNHRHKFLLALQYGFITLPKQIGKEVILGLIIASLIVSVDAINAMLQKMFHGFWGYVVVIVFSLLTYVCSTASVPIADALMVSGLTLGKTMSYLIVGPITSYSTMLVIYKNFPRTAFFIYLTTICFLSFFYGIMLDTLQIKL